MRILQIYNTRRVWGGEDRMVETTIRVLEDYGDTVIPWIRSNEQEMGRGIAGKVKAFAGGIYSPSAAHDMDAVLDRAEPDIVHAHNIYPLFSPSVLRACRRRGVPVVVHLHSYFLTCPTTFHLHDGKVCDRCLGGREYSCVLHNCRGNVLESIGYAARSAVARKLRLFQDNVTRFIALSQFAKRWLVEQGYRDEQIAVVRNTVPIPEQLASPEGGEYVAFVGRLSVEKGIGTLFAAARRTGLPVSVAADVNEAGNMLRGAPSNVTFVDHLHGDALDRFYRAARFVVVPSICRETFGLAAAEAMAHGIPVIASRLGALPELVDDGRTGLLFEPGNDEELATHMQRLWDDADLRRRMGEAARAKAIDEYGADIYYSRLTALYRDAIAEVQRVPRPSLEPLRHEL